ncbi:MAG: response regulator [Phycicoccus sp.]|nr:response regulator [Phycicoccus sp.]NMM33246.1 response regulator [Phycicoccus sp.]
MKSTDAPMQALVVVEDDPDVQFLVESIFSVDPRFNAADVAESAEAALEWSAQTAGPGVVVLDHGLAGSLTGLAAAQQIRELAPLAKIILFTAHAELKSLADEEPAIDAFLLKTDSTQLLPLAQRLTGLGALPT